MGDKQKALVVATPGNMTGMLNNVTMQKTIASLITDPKKRDSLASSMLGMVQQTKALQNCEVGTVMNCAITGASLDLPYGFGYWYAVPYANNKAGAALGLAKGEYKEAQFQIGWKGLVQLAMRSGMYKSIHTSEIKEGELLIHNPITGEIKFKHNSDARKRAASDTIGYYAMFELDNGFRKEVYWPIEDVEQHADDYSKAFNMRSYKLLLAGKIPADKLWKYSSFWYKNFDEMALKTVLKQLLSKFGMLSVQMQKATELDQASVHVSNHDTLIPKYIENGGDDPVEPVKEIQSDEPTKDTKDDKKPGGMFAGFNK